jgi:hypothetical protein
MGDVDIDFWIPELTAVACREYKMSITESISLDSSGQGMVEIWSTCPPHY